MNIKYITIVHSYPGYRTHQSVLSREEPECHICGQAWFVFHDDGSATLKIAAEDEDAATAYVTVLDVT